jgi:hypothetical protein
VLVSDARQRNPFRLSALDAIDAALTPSGADLALGAATASDNWSSLRTVRDLLNLV